MEEILNRLGLDRTVKKDLLESFNLAVIVEATKIAETKSKGFFRRDGVLESFPFLR